jgi:hypothetical protein
MPQIGSRKIAKTNFTHLVGTVSGSDSARKLLDVVRATLRTTFPPRFKLRVSRFFFDLRFVAPKVAADYAELYRFRQDGNCRFAEESSASLRPCPAGRDARTTLSRATHVGACAGVDLDRLAFLDKKRHVDGLAGFQLRRLGDVTGSIASQTFR